MKQHISSIWSKDFDEEANDYIFGKETFLSKGGHVGETKPVSLSSVESSLTSSSVEHAAGLGIRMSSDFMVSC